MPILINAEDVKVAHGEGWTRLTVADAELIGAPAMVTHRWIFEAKAQGPKLEQGDRDQLLYVIRGSGQAIVNGEEMPLTVENVLWVEPGEQYQFVAGEDGLEILQGYAPGEAPA
jgi:mannose-6-phosphate isomerase-like protein (cupin superfamily)